MPQMMYPPLDFAVYGLAPHVPVHRWLDHFNGDGVVFEVTLAHGPAHHPEPGSRWLQVTSSRPSEHSPDTPGMPPVLVGQDLLRVTTPLLRPRALSNYERAATAFFVDLANKWDEWTVASWLVDGVPTPARIVTWAGAWAGFAESSQHGIRVIGADVGDTAVDLVSLSDTSAYHFSANEPFEFPDTFEESAKAEWGASTPDRQPWPPHPDHEAFLSQ